MRKPLVVAWKDLLEFIREPRTILLLAAGAAALPAVGLLVLLAATQQAAKAAVVLCDNGSAARILAQLAAREAGAEVLPCNASLAGYAAVLIVPPGFTANATSLNRSAYVVVEVLVGSPAAGSLAGRLEYAAKLLSHALAVEKVKLLARLANVNATPASVLSPVRVRSVAITPTGRPAPPQLRAAAEAAKLLAAGMAVVVSPAAVVAADSLLIERDRRTIEQLLASPLTVRGLVVGKLASSLLLSALTAGFDAVAVVGFTLLVLPVPPILALVQVASAAVAVMFTASAALALAAAIPSRRAVGAANGVLVTLAVAVLASAAVVDYTLLPWPARLIDYLLPYASCAAAVQLAGRGEVLAAAPTLLAAAAWCAALAVVAVASANPERLVRG